MLKKLLKRYLLELLKDDFEVQIALTKIANPQLAYEIQYSKNRTPPPPNWWKGSLVKKY